MSIKRHIPNFITCFNLFFGCMAVVFALRGWLFFAVAMVMVAAIFDFCDGLAARLLRAYSLLGKELDSLADLISFGLAPAAMVHYEYTQALSHKISYGAESVPWELLSFFPFVLAVAAALRLAKFNIDAGQSDHFRGLPTPAAALLVCAMLVYTTVSPKLLPILHSYWAIPLLSAFVSLLMVSNMPMFSLKIKSLSWSGNQIRFLFAAFLLISIVLAILLGWSWSFTLLLMLSTYIALSLLLWIFVPPPCNTRQTDERHADRNTAQREPQSPSP